MLVDDILANRSAPLTFCNPSRLVGHLLPVSFSFSLSLRAVGSICTRFEVRDWHATVLDCPYQQQHINMARTRSSQLALLLSATLGLAHAVSLPEPTAAPAKIEVRAPIVTPAAVRFDDRYSYFQRRNLLDDIKSDVQGIAKSWGSVLGTDLPSYFISGKLFKNRALRSLC